MSLLRIGRDLFAASTLALAFASAANVAGAAAGPAASDRAAPASPSFAVVFELLEDSRFDEAWPALTTLAEGGDARARCLQGIARHLGAGTRSDPEAARRDWKQAAEGGSRLAARLLAGAKDESDTPEERAAWEALAAKTDGEREPMPASFGSDTPLRPKLSYFRVLLWNRPLADKGDAVACYNLAQYAFMGEGTRDRRDYVRWLRRAGDAGDAPALESLALVHALGLFGEAEDRAASAALELKAAQAGSARAQLSVAEDFLEGRGGRPEDPAEGERWLERAAAQNHPPALQKLGSLLLDREGEREDKLRGFELLERSAHLGHTQSYALVGRAHDRGRGTQRNPTEAARWYRRAGDAGDTWGWFALGALHRDGRGVPRDYQAARDCFERGAAGEDSSAMDALAELYARGLGVPQDLAKAFEWYEKAARDGHAGAQTSTGLCLLRGRGVERDPEEAVTWFELAAGKGEVTAMHNLVAVFQLGQGVKVDVARARGWREKIAQRTGRPGEIELWHFDLLEDLDPKRTQPALAGLRLSANQGRPTEAMAAKQALASALLCAQDPAIRDASEARRLARELHEAGDARGTALLAKLLWAGAPGIDREPEEAVRLFESLPQNRAGFAMNTAAYELQRYPHIQDAGRLGRELLTLSEEHMKRARPAARAGGPRTGNLPTVPLPPPKLAIPITAPTPPAELRQLSDP